MKKHYTYGEIEYSLTETLDYDFGWGEKYAASLDFNSKRLPDIEDLNSYEIPQKLALYRKSI